MNSIVACGNCLTPKDAIALAGVPAGRWSG
jgi:hypothetical protein